MNKNFILKVISAISFIIFVLLLLVGFSQYMEWLRWMRLFDAGLISEYSLEWWKIVDYEGAINTTKAGFIFGALSAIAWLASHLRWRLNNGHKRIS